MTTPSIADALAICLSRIEAGEARSIVLADYPDQADELAALIRAATAVRTHRPLPSAPFRASLQHHLSTLPPPGRPLLRLRPHMSARAWALRTAAALAAGVVAFSGLAVASADSRPGDVLYPVRRGVERVHDVADRVAPPIGRAIDYLTIRTVPDDPSASPSEPTPALAPGSTVIEPPDRPTRARNTVPPAEEAELDVTPSAGRRTLPNPGVVAVDDKADTVPPAAAVATTAVAGAPAAPTATPRRSQTPAPAGTDTPPPAAPPAVVATAVPAGAPGGISGIVADHEGTGLPGAMVSVYPIRGDGEPRWSARVSMRTQPDGTFQFGELPPGRFKLAVGELAPWVWRVWYKDTLNVKQAEPILVQPGRETDEINVRLRRNPWSFGGWGGHGRR